MEEKQRAALIRLLKIGESMVNPMKIEDWAEQQHKTEQMLLALLDLLDVFIIEEDAREVIDLAMEAKKLCIKEGEALGEGPRKLQRDINLFSMYKRLGRLISRIEAAQAPNLVNPLGGDKNAKEEKESTA
jgi:hypothetical protein